MQLIHQPACLARQVFIVMWRVRLLFRLLTPAQLDISAIPNQPLRLKLRAQKDICVQLDQLINKFVQLEPTNPLHSNQLAILAQQGTIVTVLIPVRRWSVREDTIVQLVSQSVQNTQTSILVPLVLTVLSQDFQQLVSARLAQADTTVNSKHKAVKWHKFSQDITPTTLLDK